MYNLKALITFDDTTRLIPDEQVYQLIESRAGESERQHGA